MFVPVCDRPSVAEPTEAQDRAVMETTSVTIHRKISMPARQLPITGSAHKAGIVGDDGVRALLTTLDMPAERCRAAALDRRHHLELAKADTAGIGRAPRRPVVAEDIRDLQRWTGHCCGRLRRRLGFLAAALRFPGSLALWLRQPVERALDGGDRTGGDVEIARGGF